MGKSRVEPDMDWYRFFARSPRPPDAVPLWIIFFGASGAAAWLYVLSLFAHRLIQHLL